MVIERVSSVLKCVPPRAEVIDERTPARKIGEAVKRLERRAPTCSSRQFMDSLDQFSIGVPGVFAPVFRRGQDLKIARLIVLPIMVAMMDNLSAGKSSPYLRLNDHSMLGNTAAFRVPDMNVPPAHLAAALPTMVVVPEHGASARTKPCHIRWPTLEGFSADRADMFNCSRRRDTLAHASYSLGSGAAPPAADTARGPLFAPILARIGT